MANETCSGEKGPARGRSLLPHRALGIGRLLDHPAICLGLTAFALHLWVNGSYGYFRDELYFIVCGRHPAWGYTDQPPLTPVIAAASDAAFHSLRGLRLIPAMAAGATVALTASTAGMLGGGLYAGWLAALRSWRAARSSSSAF